MTMPPRERRTRRIWVDSGPAGGADPGGRIIAFVAEDWEYQLGPPRFPPPGTRTSLSMTDIMEMTLPPPPLAMKSYMDGFEGSDLVGVYAALDEAGEVAQGDEVEVLGDGQVFGALGGRGKVSARYAGKNWAPEMMLRIRELEKRFPRVVYRTVASAQNRAGHLVKAMKREYTEKNGRLWWGGSALK